MGIYNLRGVGANQQYEEIIGKSKKSLGERSEPHTSESQLRSDMYICLYHQKFKGQCVSIQRSMRVHSQRLCSNVNISTRELARPTALFERITSILIKLVRQGKLIFD